MENFLDDINYDGIEERIKGNWKEFREQLANNEFCYDDMNKAVTSTFLSVFDSLFENGKRFFEKKVSQVLSLKTSVVRAARINLEDPEPDYGRFIPKAEFIREDNRFSPPGKEWLYLAFSDDPSLGKFNDADGKFNDAEKCALKECRADIGETFALCEFRIENRAKKKKLVDLTIASDKSYKIINEELMKTYSFGNREKVEKWIVYTYSKLLKDQIFVPIETKNKSLMYAPFQCLAQYFFYKGYVGIVYSSTVCPNGKNVVLFDKKLAKPVGKIKKCRIENNL